MTELERLERCGEHPDGLGLPKRKNRAAIEAVISSTWADEPIRALAVGIAWTWHRRHSYELLFDFARELGYSNRKIKHAREYAAEHYGHLRNPNPRVPTDRVQERTDHDHQTAEPIAPPPRAARDTTTTAR